MQAWSGTWEAHARVAMRVSKSCLETGAGFGRDRVLEVSVGHQHLNGRLACALITGWVLRYRTGTHRLAAQHRTY